MCPWLRFLSERFVVPQVTLPYGGTPLANLIKHALLRLDFNTNGVPALRSTESSVIAA